MAAVSMAAGTEINISEDDLAAFHANHFSAISINHFSTQFLGPDGEDYPEELQHDDDGLGYYNDGVKRTLTDQQIAIFRHSEIQALLRERPYAGDARKWEAEEKTADIKVSGSAVIEDNLEDGELEADIVRDPAIPPPVKNGAKISKKERKAQKAKEKGFFKLKIKPDLRKRTWDNVDSGLGILNYDGETSTTSVFNQAPQRRKISYDED